jgi:hypothetical protein
VADIEVLEFGEVGDGRRDRTDEIGDAGDREEEEEREVSEYGGWNWKGFREVEVGEIKVIDAVSSCLGAKDTCPFAVFAAVCGWVP